MLPPTKDRVRATRKLASHVAPAPEVQGQRRRPQMRIGINTGPTAAASLRLALRHILCHDGRPSQQMGCYSRTARGKEEA
jgi:hypothetical protein